jgi:class 3 adenylate cyclase
VKTMLERRIAQFSRWLDVNSGDAETRRRGRLLNAVLAALLVGALIGIGRALYRTDPLWSALAMLGVIAMAYAFNRQGKPSVAGHLLILTSLALSFTNADLVQHGIAVWLIVPILAAGMILGPYVGLAYGIGIVALAMVVRMTTQPVMISSMEIGLLGVAVLLTWLSSIGIDRAIRTLSLRTVELEQANAALAAREKLRELFGRFVSPEVAQAAMQRGVKLGGRVVEVSILFADIRNFTGLSERLTPNQIVALLNRFLCALVPVVNLHKGLVIEFGGDSIMAVFGTPVLPAPDHALRAVHCALAMRRALGEFNIRQKGAGEPTLSIGIGISTGPVVAGHIGCEERLEYTVIGDSVNLASRLQQLTREWGNDIVISEETFVASGGNVVARPVKDVTIRGRQQTITAYAVEVVR